MSKRNLVLTPSNSTSTNEYASQNNQNVLRFDIGSSGLMIGKDIRLEAEVEFYKTDGNTPIVHGDDFNLDPYIGYHSLIQGLTWTSRKFNEKSMERIQSYPLLAKAVMSALSSREELETAHNNESMSKGMDMNGLNNNQLKFKGLQKSARKAVLGRRPFSLRLISGICMSDPIPLNAVQGLTLEIVLSQPSQCLFGAQASAGIGGHFKIINPRLHVPTLIMNDSAISNPESSGTQTISFKSYSHIFDTVDSTVTTHVHRLGLRNVLNTMMIFTPVKFLNNYSENSFGFYDPGMKKLNFYRNSEQFPLAYTTINDHEDGVIQAKQHTTKPEYAWNYLSAFQPTDEVRKTSLTPININGKISVTGGAIGSGSRQSLERKGYSAFTFGCSFDETSGYGIDLTVDNLSYAYEMSLEDPEDNTTTTSYAVNYFYLNNNYVTVNSNQGILKMSVNN